MNPYKSTTHLSSYGYQQHTIFGETTPEDQILSLSIEHLKGYQTKLFIINLPNLPYTTHPRISITIFVSHGAFIEGWDRGSRCNVPENIFYIVRELRMYGKVRRGGNSSVGHLNTQLLLLLKKKKKKKKKQIGVRTVHQSQ